MKWKKKPSYIPFLHLKLSWHGFVIPININEKLLEVIVCYVRKTHGEWHEGTHCFSNVHNYPEMITSKIGCTQTPKESSSSSSPLSGDYPIHLHISESIRRILKDLKTTTRFKPHQILHKSKRLCPTWIKNWSCDCTAT